MVERDHRADHKQVVTLLDLGAHAGALEAANIPMIPGEIVSRFLDDFGDTKNLHLAIVLPRPCGKCEDIAHVDSASHDILHGVNVDEVLGYKQRKLHGCPSVWTQF